MKSSLCSFLHSVVSFLTYTNIRDAFFSHTLNLRMKSQAVTGRREHQLPWSLANLDVILMHLYKINLTLEIKFV
jgi:hypothetical protein